MQMVFSSDRSSFLQWNLQPAQEGPSLHGQVEDYPFSLFQGPAPSLLHTRWI